MFVFASIQSNVVSILGVALAIVGVCALTAIVSPRSFAVLVGRGNRWIDTSGVLAKLDRRIDVDALVLPFSRVFGAATLAAVVFLAFVLYGR